MVVRHSDVGVSNPLRPPHCGGTENDSQIYDAESFPLAEGVRAPCCAPSTRKTEDGGACSVFAAATTTKRGFSKRTSNPAIGYQVIRCAIFDSMGSISLESCRSPVWHGG